MALGMALGMWIFAWDPVLSVESSRRQATGKQSNLWRNSPNLAVPKAPRIAFQWPSLLRGPAHKA